MGQLSMMIEEMKKKGGMQAAFISRVWPLSTKEDKVVRFYKGHSRVTGPTMPCLSLVVILIEHCGAFSSEAG